MVDVDAYFEGCNLDDGGGGEGSMASCVSSQISAYLYNTTRPVTHCCNYDDIHDLGVSD